MQAAVLAESIRVGPATTRLRRFTQWIAKAAVLLFAMEFAARVDDKINHGASIFDNYTFDQLFEFDGRVLHGKPNAKYMKWSLNNIGLRGPDVDLSQPRPRVIVYGASEVFGIYESLGQDFPRRLEAELRMRAKSDQVEVINAGIPGMRIGSGSAFLTELSEQVKPAVVVLYPTPTHYLRALQPYCGRPGRQPLAAVGKAASPSSRLKKKFIERMKEVLPPSAIYTARKAEIGFFMLSHEEIKHVSASSLMAMETDLRCAVKAVRASGAQAILVTHANRFGSELTQEDKYLMTGWRKLYPAVTEGALLEIERRANLIIKEVAVLEQVPLVDADERMTGKREYFADHAHFSDAGANHMSQLLVGTVQSVLNKRAEARPQLSEIVNSGER